MRSFARCSLATMFATVTLVGVAHAQESAPSAQFDAGAPPPSATVPATTPAAPAAPGATTALPGTSTPAPPPISTPPLSSEAAAAQACAVPADQNIAPPSADAPPDKVEKARQIAKESQLTPILPSPSNPVHPAFQLYYEVDLPILGVSTAFAFGRFVKSQKAFCAPLCDPNDLNALDRVTAGWYDSGWSTASDYMLYGSFAIGALVLTIDEGFLDALNDSVVVTESVVSTTAVASIMTLAAGRPRPLLFGTNAPLDVRNSSDAGLSFLSGHAAAASSLATSIFIAEKRLHPGSKWPWILLGATGALAVSTGVSRILAGRHFITDVTGGLIVGSSCGILIPSLHGSPVRVVPVVSDTQRGLSLVGTF